MRMNIKLLSTILIFLLCCSSITGQTKPRQQRKTTVRGNSEVPPPPSDLYSMGRWFGGFLKDEFGDIMKDKPFIACSFGDEYKVPVVFRFSCFDGWHIIMNPENRHKFTNYGSVSMRIKQANGQVWNVPCRVIGDQLHIVDEDAVSRLADLLEEGNLKIKVSESIFDDGTTQDSWLISIRNESVGIYTAATKYLWNTDCYSVLMKTNH